MSSRAEQLLPTDRSNLGNPLENVPTLTDELRTALDIDEVDANDVRCLVYKPAGSSGPIPVVISIHGGAFCFFAPDDFAGLDAIMAASFGCAVVGVDYRLAPQHPHPAAIDDCWTALRWTVAQPWAARPLVVTGGSAGGALSAALCLRSRDEGGPPIDYQALLIPVIDDRCETPSMRSFREGHPGFNGLMSEGMWLHYLGEDTDRSIVSPYAAPARATDLSGLPPAFVMVNGLDPLRDEGIDYARRLMEAGVPVELHVVPGAYHGADALDPEAAARGGMLLFQAIGQALKSPVS